MYKQLIDVANFSILKQTFVLVEVLAIVCVQNRVYAQIIPDNTLGSENSIVIPNVTIKNETGDRIDGGAIRGANLFHSFQQFNVGDGQRVYFANPTGIENILSRVTGKDLSNILGTLGVNGNANLFLLNPNGIIFGENAKLDVGGSFVGSTASAIQFGDRGFFSAIDPEIPPLLTVNPSAFFFNQIQAGKIENKSTAPAGVDPLEKPLSGLRVPDGRSLLLLGGDIAINGGVLNALGGRVELAGIADLGTVGLEFNGNDLSLNVPGDLAKANVSIANGEIDVRTADNGGSIAIDAKNFQVLPTSNLWAGIREGLGTINSQAGDISIAAESVSLSGVSTIVNSVRPNAIGNGGDINIQAGSLSLTEGAEIIANINTQGNAGNINIQVRDRAVFDGTDSDGFPSGVLNVIRKEAKGNSGKIQLRAGSLSMTNGAVVQTKSEGEGNSGDITIDVRDDIFLDAFGTKPRGSTGIFATSDTESFIQGGNINITAKSLFLENGGTVSATAFGNGNAGNVTIQVRNLASFDGFVSKNIENSESGVFTGVAGVGQGGNIEISADSFSLTNGALLSAVTVGEGNAGNIVLNVQKDINISGTSSGQETGIFAKADPSSTGNGGNIFINSKTLTLMDGARIAVDSQGTGQGGNIQIQANSLSLDNGTSISAETASNTGGNINSKLQDLLLLRGNSKISTTAGRAQAGGNGGNITIDTPFIVAFPSENSDITANAFTGRGGRVTIDTQAIFGTQFRSQRTRKSDITASSEFGLSGMVEINTPDLDPSQQQIELPTDTINVAGLINQSLCRVGEGSEFILTGRGGLPNSPKDLLNAEPSWEDWRIISEKNDLLSRNSLHSNSKNLNNKHRKIVEAQGWKTTSDGKIILTAEPFGVVAENLRSSSFNCKTLREKR
jgi:filamentous hemagglutinin family protein